MARATCYAYKCKVKKGLWPRIIDGITYWFCDEHKKAYERPNKLGWDSN